MAIDRTEASQTFDTYVADYDASNPRIALKVDHTYRVAELCARIARSIGLSPDDVDLAWLCGLLHDIGRFEQVRRYDTFNDAKSTSHAALGVEILFGEGRIRDYLPQDEYGDAYDELVRTVVGTHSDFRLPEDLDERTQTFCDILRDADKIDILKATTLSEPEAIFGVSREELLQSELERRGRRVLRLPHRAQGGARAPRRLPGGLYLLCVRARVPGERAHRPRAGACARAALDTLRAPRHRPQGLGHAGAHARVAPGAVGGAPASPSCRTSRSDGHCTAGAEGRPRGGRVANRTAAP